jgi:hypothetical protein
MNYGMGVIALAGLLTLGACGGGGGSSGGGGGGGSTTTLTLSGTAAKGAALASATVTAKCDGGTGTATTGADGTYTIALTSGTLPCVLKVSDTSVTPAVDYYSVAVGSGTTTTATANITPVTQLVVATLLGNDPASFYANFVASSDASKLTPSAVDAAKTAVVTQLQAAGVTIPPDAGDFLTGTLVAGTGTAGNSADAVLENLATTLATDGSTLAEFTSVVQNATTTVAKAESCPALRSGTYRIVVPGMAGGDGSGNTEKIVIDAVTLAVTFADNSTATLVPVANSPCRFNDAAGVDLVVAQSGVLGIKTADGYFAIAFPEQTIPVADLAGDWNAVGYDHNNATDPMTAISLTATFSSTGTVTLNTVCVEGKSCQTGAPSRTLTVATDGGFVLACSCGNSRLFAYRAPNGAKMFVVLGPTGEIGVGVPAASIALPDVGRVRTGWNVGTLQQLLPDGTYAPIAFDIGGLENTVLSVDTAASSFVRRNVINFTTTPVITRDETITVNKVADAARPGYFYRVPNATSTNSTGALSRTTEFIGLAMPGLGMNATAFPAPAWGTPTQTQFLLSIFKP